ncbi:DUF7373 family lipoprotein [Nocardia sp. CDC160]|uniref:DUF7373 family lipoprotein n=1 Tax=Nocardia sp. CDC160 TaxID=3112166 RepID=UPI002DB5E46D|nr:hypothetical protein [Nocardia sp. CDC160]MEC3916691.1 hypothetical protein [Nocardia sp. CDC160]
MGHPARVATAITCLALTALLAGCGKSGTAVPGEMDVRTLDTGTYPVNRYTYDSNNGGKGNTLEGMRMAAAVAPTVNVDSSLNIGRGGVVLSTVDDVVNVSHLSSAVKNVLSNRGFITGYAASGSDRTDINDQPDPKGTTITTRVLRFPTVDSAKLAARELEDADFNVALNVNQKLTLPDYPDAYAHWRPGVPNIGVTMARKDFVISLFIIRPSADQKDLLSWAKKTLDADVPMVDAFQETPADKIAGLPVDPDRMLARTLVSDRDNLTPDQDNFAVFPGNWQVLFADDMGYWVKLVADTGADETASADGNFVTRVRDAKAGEDYVTRMISNLQETAAPAPDKVPDTKCVHRQSDKTPSRCYVRYKRYVGVVGGTSDSDAQKKAAAQYALLANSL